MSTNIQLSILFLFSCSYLVTSFDLEFHSNFADTQPKRASQFESFTKVTLPREGPYSPTWDSLDKRPIPQWFDDAKVGIFLHWGVYAVPARGEWFWYYWHEGDKGSVQYMTDNYRPNFTYADFAPRFVPNSLIPMNGHLCSKLQAPNMWFSLQSKSLNNYFII